MKLMFASDIHGSSYFAELMLKKYREEGAERLILLGDLLYHGPRNDLPHGYAPKEVIELLNSVKNEILCVRGNCDTEVDQMVLSFPILADYALIYLDNKAVYITHGHKYNPESLPPLKDGDILMNGHTHISDDKIIKTDFGSVRYLNPGSVSIPKNGTGHSYLIYENGDFTLKNII